MSWHGQHVTIWRIKNKQNKASSERVHRVIARIAVNGDESIAEAALSQDGQLLAVAAASETRLFRLVPTADATVDSVKVQKVKLEASLPGGSAVRISPDQKWLSIISHANEVILFRFTDGEDGVHVSRKPFRLARSKRGADTSSLQTYRRAITRQQFSADSRVLALTDLSGFIDCWTLEGEEDLSAPAVEMKDDEDDSSNDSSSEDEDEDVESKSYGQFWKTMESAKSLPQLDSSALLLSFRPGKKIRRTQQNGVKPKQQVNGANEKSEVHPSDGEEEEEEEGAGLIEKANEKYELLVLTASHQLYELDLSTGKLTDWSRRNTTDRLPEAFHKLKDRAMGGYWHTRPDAQRLYLYGSNWLFMFDVDKNLEGPEQKEEQNLIARPNKRKWEGESGAGDKLRDEDYTGFKPGVVITQDGAASQKRIKKEEQQNLIKVEGEEEDADEDDEHDAHASRSLRVKQDADAQVNTEDAEEGPRRTWHSFAYRPILAVVPLNETAEYIETVIVERPSWELDLPPRLVGPHDKAR